MSARDPLPMAIRPGQTWRTAAGHLVKIYQHFGPSYGGPFPHHGEYLNGPVDGYRNQTFSNDGSTGIDGDRLAELISE